ncbi:hypothetical protein BKA70DRAFT_1417059 [Coprinopsis sp. MPI-PUGE-AT-0042]|nr:hypothetical protein BKA70DRAFT_1417059 [Coprinopsis sp. MPI-PUGE-AT-0042]
MATIFPPSPATTTSSLASYVSTCSEDDIIVWGLSDSENSQPSSSAVGAEYHSDDDFVLLQMPTVASESAGGISASGTTPLADFGGDCASSTPVTSTSIVLPPAVVEELADSLDYLSLSLASRPLLGDIAAEGQNACSAPDTTVPPCKLLAPSKARSNPAASSSSAIVLVAGALKSKPSRRKKRKVAKARKAQAPSNASSGTETPESDDSHTSIEDQTRLFEEASNYITAYLTHPEAKANQVCKLTLLQSLLIELGLAKASSALPTSLRAATQIIKSTVFINIKEYLLVRTQGPDAILKAMYPSRSALMKAMKKKANRAPLQWVKDHGLNVLLVTCFR